MIIGKAQNQHGEEFTCHEIFMVENQWIEETRRVISREEVKKIVGKKIEFLPQEEREDLTSPSFEKKVIESFALKGLSIKEIENWCKNCYLLEMNPLPLLREFLPYANIEFAYDEEKIPSDSGEEKGIVYVIGCYPGSEIKNVSIVLVPPKLARD